MTQEEYDNKREELVESFVMDLDDEDVIALHNAYCEVSNDPDSTIFPNDEYTFNEMMGNKDPYDLAMDLTEGDYNTNHDYFTVGIYGLVSFDSPYDSNSPVCLNDILNLGVDDVVDLLNVADIEYDDLKDGLDNLKAEYEEAVAKNKFKEDWDKCCQIGLPIFEFINGKYCYINYDEESATLKTGSVVNAGFCLNEDTVEMEVDYDFSLDENLENLYQLIIEERPEYEEENNA